MSDVRKKADWEIERCEDCGHFCDWCPLEDAE